MIKRSRASGITSAFAADTDRAEPTARSEGINQITFSHLDKVEVGESIEYEVTDSNDEPAVFLLNVLIIRPRRIRYLRAQLMPPEHGKFPIQGRP